MPLTPGTRLGPYEIVASLGAGGMGEVYRAKDLRLGREVALKVLPADVATHPDRLARFEREARTVAGLSHPNIVVLHSVEDDGDVRFLTMELVEGQSLDQHVEPGGLPLARVLDIGIALADALTTAHEKGVVHRDLKPANVMLTREGRVKVLDFGLAKLAAEPAGSAPEASQAATLAAPLTSAGFVVGTVPYMAPEQVRGETVDARTDLFSFGAVLYEMLTGARAFAKNSATETLAAILRDDPPEPEAGGRPVPAGLERIIHHCLEKNPSQRFRSAHDVAFALEHLSTGSGITSVEPSAAQRRWKTPWTAAIVVLVAAAAGLAGWVMRGGAPPEPVFHRLTFEQGTVENARFGPDGKTVLYSARWKGGPPTLYSIPTGSLESQRLNVASSTLLAVSKDNELAVVLSPLLTYGLYPGTLARVPASGGGAREIEPSVLAADWNPVSGELAAVTVRRAEWTLESPPGKALRSSAGIDYPRFSARDGALAFFENQLGLGWPLLPRAGDIVVLDAAGHTRVLAKDRRCTGLAWSAKGDEVWFSEWTEGRRTALCAVSLAGKVRTIWSGPGHVALQDIAADGRALVQTRQVQDGVLVLEEGATRERDLSIYDGTFSIDFMPDRRAILVNERGAGGGPEGSVFLAPVDGGLPTKLAKGRAEALSPDGKLVLVGTAEKRGIYTLVPTGSGPSTVVDLAGIASNQIARFFPDGQRFVFQGAAAGKPIRLYAVDLGSHAAPKPLTVEGTLVWQGGDPVSPDGKYVFVIKDLGANAVDELVSVADGTETPIAGKEARDIPIRWTADGRGIYVFKREGLPVRIFRLDPWTGKKELVKEFMPADPGGITGMSTVTMSADAKVFAFNYRRRISELFLVEGLR